MNVAITFGRKGSTWTPITLPHEGTVRDQIKAFYALGKDTSVREKFSEIQLWTQVSGRVKRQVFDPTDGARVLTLEQLREADEALGRKPVATEEDAEAAEAAPVKGKKAKKAKKPTKATKAAEAAEAAPVQGAELLG